MSVLAVELHADAPVTVAQNVAFGLIALLMVVSAIKVVTSRNVVHAALYLVLVSALTLPHASLVAYMDWRQGLAAGPLGEGASIAGRRARGLNAARRRFTRPA